MRFSCGCCAAAGSKKPGNADKLKERAKKTILAHRMMLSSSWERKLMERALAEYPLTTNIKDV
jgi:hypothetical protein